MTTRAPITAIILAGGRSTRMQTNKAQLLWRGRSFIEHIVEQLLARVDTVAISCNDQTPYHHLGLPLLADPFADGRGPLAGILAGLRFSTTPLTLFVPCDNPQLAPDLIPRLDTALQQTDSDVTHARSNGNNHYLHALLRTRLHDSASDFLQRGDFAVHRWYLTQKCCAVNFDDEPQYFRNINKPADLLQLPE